MIIGGLQKFSLLDYPDHISAIIFTQGCNFRCQFCYNPMLVWPVKAGEVKYATSSIEEEGEGHTLIKEDDLFRFLKSRTGKLQAIVITGGEPTLHKDLAEFIKKIRDLGFLVKLDTNGTNPMMLKKLIKEKLINYIAMDIKASEEGYEKVVDVKVDFEKIKESVKIIINSSLPHEFRTTVVPGLITEDDIKSMGGVIRGADAWYLQKFKSDIELVNKNFQGQAAFTDIDMKKMEQLGQKYVKICQTR